MEIEDAHDDLLGALVAADEVAGQAQTFVLTWAGMDEPRFAGVLGVDDDARAPTDVQVDNMADFGWVRVSHVEGKVRHFALRPEGRRAWRRRVAQLNHAPIPVTLDWTVARPLLKQIFDGWTEAGVPNRASTCCRSLRTRSRASKLLHCYQNSARAGFLEVAFESLAGPQIVRPGSRRCRCSLAGP